MNKTYVNGYRHKAKTVTCYTKAWCIHRISRVPNLIQVLNAKEVRCSTKIKFHNLRLISQSNLDRSSTVVFCAESNFVISRSFFIYFTITAITGVKKIVRYTDCTEDFKKPLNAEVHSTRK